MRADRLISIVLLLQANGRMTAENLASRLEVSQRTILRDMDALSTRRRSGRRRARHGRRLAAHRRVRDEAHGADAGGDPLVVPRAPAGPARGARHQGSGRRRVAQAAGCLARRRARAGGIRATTRAHRLAQLARLRGVADELARSSSSRSGAAALEIRLRESGRRVERARGRPARARRARQPLVSHRGQRRRAPHLSRFADSFGRRS